jgi:AraC-like DNA-binding protein
LDSSPLWGRGRVEDTLNLLGHAAHQVIGGLAALAQQEVAHVIEQIGLSLFDAASLKAALDIDWADADQKHHALQRLCDELDALQNWIGTHFPQERQSPPLAAALHTLQVLRAQDLEPDPVEGGTRIRQGVAKDRQISITDPEMRHGRKSSSSRFDGYKRHIAQDLDEGVILAAEWLDHAVAGADPDRRRRLEQQITALENLDSADLTGQLRRALRTLLLTRQSSLEQVARLFALPRRTLNRRLEEQGTTFQGLVYEVRYEIARQLLEDTRMSMGQIAATLDYGDASAFSRAFRCWSGQNPTAWRARLDSGE